MTADDTPAQAGAWLSIPEAAKRLRIHVRTVHRWLDDGRLTKRELARGRVEVWVSDAIVPDDPPESTPEMPQDTPELGLAVMSQHMALLERQGEIAAIQVAQQMTPLLEELAATRRQLTEQAEEIGRLRAELARHETPSDIRPWWRRWFAP